MRELYERWINAPPATIEYVEGPPAGFETTKLGGTVRRMEHPALGIRENVPWGQVHDLRSRGWYVHIGEHDFGQVVHFQAWYLQVRMFSRLQWIILDAPADRFFIIADRPVVWGFGEVTNEGPSLTLDVPPSALRDPRIQLVAPLTRSIALFGFHPDGPVPETILPEHVNRILAAGARRWIAGPTEATVAAAFRSGQVH